MFATDFTHNSLLLFHFSSFNSIEVEFLVYSLFLLLPLLLLLLFVFLAHWTIFFSIEALLTLRKFRIL